LSDSDDYPFKYEWAKDYPRVVKAPDGIEYLVNLKGWFWNSLDWLIAEEGWTEESFIQSAWRAARNTQEAGTMENPGVFKNEFEMALGMCIQEEIHVTMARIDGHENDNKPPE
jgi:hypothetical protein